MGKSNSLQTIIKDPPFRLLSYQSKGSLQLYLQLTFCTPLLIKRSDNRSHIAMSFPLIHIHGVPRLGYQQTIIATCITYKKIRRVFVILVKPLLCQYLLCAIQPVLLHTHQNVQVSIHTALHCLKFGWQGLFFKNRDSHL